MNWLSADIAADDWRRKGYEAHVKPLHNGNWEVTVEKHKDEC